MNSEEIQTIVNNLCLKDKDKIENSFTMQFSNDSNDIIIKNFINMTRNGFYYKDRLINVEFIQSSTYLLYTNTIYRVDLVEKLVNQTIHAIESTYDTKINYLFSIQLNQ